MLISRGVARAPKNHPLATPLIDTLKYFFVILVILRVRSLMTIMSMYGIEDAMIIPFLV